MSKDTSHRDDLGEPVDRPASIERVVSLVPSLTESIALTRPEALVAATDWCTFPPDLQVERIRGTKNPDCRAIIAMRPDLVIANMEENRAIDVKRLRDAGLPVWVTRIETVDQALASMRRMFEEGLGWSSPQWLDDATAAWAGPPEPLHATAAVVIWRHPWMAVGPRTFTNDVITRLGLSNAFGDRPERYPSVSIEELDDPRIGLVLLPDEPYVFTKTDGPEAFSRTRTVLVNGRLLSWYGPSLAHARVDLAAAITAELPTG